MSHMQVQKPMIPIVQAPEAYGKHDDTLLTSMLSQQLIEDVVQSPMAAGAHIGYFDKFNTGYECFVHYPALQKYADESARYSDHPVIFNELVKANTSDIASTRSDVSLSGSNYDAENDYHSIQAMLVEDSNDIHPKQHVKLEPAVLHGLRTHDIDNNTGSHFVQTPCEIPSKAAAISRMPLEPLAGVIQSEQQEKWMTPEPYAISGTDKENTFDIPLSVGLSKNDSGYTSIIEEPEYARQKYPIELEKVSLSGLSNDQSSVDDTFDTTQSRLPVVYSEEWMLADELKAQADLQEHMFTSDVDSCYQDASESMSDNHIPQKGDDGNQLMRGLVSYEKSNVSPNWLNIGVLPGVKSDMKLYDDAVSEPEEEIMESGDLEFGLEAFPLVGVSNNQDIPLKNWLNTDNLSGVQHEMTAVYDNAQAEIPNDYIDPEIVSDMQQELDMLSGIRMDMPPAKNWLNVDLSVYEKSNPCDNVHQPVSKEESQMLKKSSSTINDATSPKDKDDIETPFPSKKDDTTKSKHHDATFDLPELTEPGKPPCEEKSKALPPLPTSTAHSSDDDEQSVASFGSIQPSTIPGLPKKQPPHHNMIVERANWPIMTDVADCKD